MQYMLCRNRVIDYQVWKSIFDSHSEAHPEAELHLRRMWRSLEDPNNIFFLFEISDLEKAKAFVGAPDVDEVAKAAGVLDGEIHYVEDLPDLNK